MHKTSATSFERPALPLESALTSEDKSALEAEIEILKHEKPDMLLGIEEALDQKDKPEETNAKLEEEITQLRARLGDVQSELDARNEQETTMEAKYKKLLMAFDDYRRHVRKMGNEWVCNES